MPRWIYPDFDLRPSRPLFMCIISNTHVGKIPGVSAAGVTPELTFYTPGADAELVEFNRIVTMPGLPETPGGCPTPGIITRAALSLTGVPALFVASGLEKKPAVPYVELGGAAGGDIRYAPGVPEAPAIMERAELLGRKVSTLSDCIFIGESIAGGTTTALAVLHAIGYNGSVSSSFDANPIELKLEIVRQALKRCDAEPGEFRNDIMRAIVEFGDPMIPCALGLLKGIGTSTRVVLSGGTQLAAVLLLARRLGIDGDFSIATTKYVAEDRSASFRNIVEDSGWPYHVVDPGLERSRIPVIQAFTRGFVKEGVGAGGAALLAGILGVTQERLVEETDRVLMTVELPGCRSRA
ncbi:nicotinate mononucleotide-dependent phosphoribosyltransferase CobT [Methanothrix sp.]|uniref:nicotinate mononucleotide-dependent phosphoribosyltransferase CobT n=1 Tax=Methanothrix sp. TaxID=90426 RepID=UPI003C72CC72